MLPIYCSFLFESNTMAMNLSTLKNEAFRICFPKNYFPENFKFITVYKLPIFRICTKIKESRYSRKDFSEKYQNFISKACEYTDQYLADVIYDNRKNLYKMSHQT